MPKFEYDFSIPALCKNRGRIVGLLLEAMNNINADVEMVEYFESSGPDEDNDTLNSIITIKGDIISSIAQQYPDFVGQVGSAYASGAESMFWALLFSGCLKHDASAICFKDGN